MRDKSKGRRSLNDGGKLPVVRFLTKKDAITESLRNEILSGALPPGTQLRQEDVALRLGVSATPVREAFGALEAEGFLERRPHRGVVVQKKNFRQLEDVYEIRSVLEAVAIRRAAEDGNQDILIQLEEAVRESALALKRRDAHGFREASAKFHQVLASAPRSPTFVGIMAKLISHSTFFVPLDRPRMFEAHAEHVQMLNAVRRHDPDRAVVVLMRHVQANLNALRQARTTSTRSQTELDREQVGSDA